MKKILTSSLLLLSSAHSFAQRYDDTRTYDVIGLPDGEEVSDCIINALPFLAIGIIILLIYYANSKSNSQNEKGSWWGCIGLALIGVSVIIMLPLLAWIEAISVSAIMIIGAIVFVLYILYSIFGGK